jgi:hypothetical protein
MAEIIDPPIPGRATAEWIVMYPDPVDVRAGETVTLGEEDQEWPGWVWCTDARGKSSWAPTQYVERGDGGGATMRQDYVARELALAVGDEVLLHKLLNGWYWATNARGESGWIPASHVETAPSAE